MKGMLRINNGQLESTITSINLSVTNTMTAAEIVSEGLIQFDLAVNTQYIHVSLNPFLPTQPRTGR